MELPVASDGVDLAAYRPRVPLSVPNGKETPVRFNESGYYHCYGDRNSVASHGSVAQTGYETLDTPPHYDFYANSEAWGRRRRFRPSLYQLYANPGVRILCFLSACMLLNSFRLMNCWMRSCLTN